ncbi:uncharacterized protein RSE6_06073 [Rhynchosporium secalis]|uniref:Uncharacterized protein n=1 Tax=Rhynchosporium secalis TaxID=38038 RepID=A0A1E1M9F2_RHYSE|nr:uncharacterized protein RSE6_06073 [Rhynchosporium secalis]
MQPRKLSRLEYESVFPSSTNSTLDVDKTCRISTPYGIGLAATSALKAGSLIIKLHPPNLLLVEKSSLQTICSFCILESSSLKRCSGCKILYYCSKKCQNRHWKEIHRLECKILKVLPDIPPTAVRALIVMLSREPIESQGTEEKTWKELESHVSELKGERKRWEEIFLQARAGVEFTKAGGARMEDAIRWLCVLSTNAFRITLPDNTPVGLCFSPTLARANHSCDPNAFIVFDSNTVSLRALRPIKLEEQIFISYVDPTEDIILRQSRLKERYFFTCKCPRCVSEENVYEHFIWCEREDESRGKDGRRMEVLNPRQELLKTAERCQIYIRQNTSLLAATNSSKTASLLKQSRDNTQKSPQTRIGYLLSALKCHSSLNDNTIFAFPPYPEIVHETYLTYIDMQAFTPALITILFLFFNCDMFTYPQPHHPVRVIRLYTIAKLLKHLASLNPTEILQDISSISTGTNISSFSNLSMMEDIAKAMQGLDFIKSFHVMVILAWSEAKKSHGEESRFVKEIEAEIGDVEEVQRLRGPTGENLRKWMGDEASVDGGMEAERVGAGLRKLAGLMGGILG